MQTMVNPPLGTPTYVASGVADLADFFSARSRNEYTLSEHSESQREQHKHSAAAIAYADVASVLRKTSMEVAWLAYELDAQGGPQESPRRYEMLGELMKHFSMRDLDIMQAMLP